MAEKHTPGPWRVNGGAATVFMYDIVGPKGEDIAYANPSNGADEPTMYPVEANARLIAAAPDLLAALNALVAGVERDDNPRDEGHSEHSDEMTAARAAIAKAEGVALSASSTPAEKQDDGARFAPPPPRNDRAKKGIG